VSNRFFITILVVAAVVVGAFAYTKHQSNNKTGGSSSTSAQPSNHTEGSSKTGVVLIEYGDYQCPACGQYYPIVKQVYDTYKDQIMFQFRNFPLLQIHKNAFAGARAAEAADKQGKYWEMHDILYENQQTWGAATDPSTFFESYAQQLKLDVAKFKVDYASQAVNDLINADISEGQKIGANSTPTFVLNGKKIDQNPRSLDEFNKLIDAAIKQKTGQ
jgi:protein-disulfide isomerase